MKIKELFTDESKWIKQYTARNINGKEVWSNSKQAICWCLFGAVLKCYPGEMEFINVLDRINREIENFIVWNDNPDRTFEDVKKLVEKLDI